MNLETLLTFQIGYCLVGIGYNIVSKMRIHKGSGGLAPTNPSIGILIMIGYGLLLTPGFLGWFMFYRLSMGLSILILGMGGVVVHLRNLLQRNLGNYSSRRSLLVALAINTGGLFLNLISALGAWN